MAPQDNEKITINTSINAEILEDIYLYCEWANIDNISVFIESASKIYIEDKNKNL